MFKASLCRISNTLPVILTTLITAASVFPRGEISSLVAEPPAQILAIIVNDSVVSKSEGDQVVITRASDGGCPPVTDIMKGVPLCKGDRLTTARNVKVKIGYGNPTNRDEVMMGSSTEPSEITIGSADCGLVCQLFCWYANPFKNRRQRVTFANHGTVYEVKGEQDGSARLMVYEGRVDVSKDEDQPSSTGSVPETTDPRPTPQVTVEPVQVDSLSMAILDAEGNVTEHRPLRPTEVCQKLAPSTATEIALHATPPEAGGNFAKYVNYPLIAARNEAFESARCGSFLEPKYFRNFLDLAKVYNDWGDAEQALKYLAKATAVFSGLVDEDLWLNKGIALRQTGEYEKALTELDRVVSTANSTHAADALNIRGSIFYDRARKLMIASQSEEATTEAEALLEQAQQEYEKGEQQKPTQLALEYLQVNEAQVSKAQGDILKRRGKFGPAASSYIRAIAKIGAAYGRFDNPKNKVAGLLVARAYAALADADAAMGNSADSFQDYGSAERTFKASIAEAERQNQKFAQSYCGLASLYLILGDDKARDNYDKCVAYNILALVKETDVPNVVGLRRPNAIQVLAEAGLEPEFVTNGEKVVNQEPLTGRIKIGTKVKLTLDDARERE
jgi:tetratricopeptide (TPR) repeat protein